MDAGECLNYIGEKMLLAMYAWGIGKAGQRRMRRKLGSWIRTTGMNIRRRRRRIIRNIASWKLNVKYVNVEWGNAIGQDIWWVGSICWGAVVEKLMGMWGGGGGWDEGKAWPSHYYYIYIYMIPYAFVQRSEGKHSCASKSFCKHHRVGISFALTWKFREFTFPRTLLGCTSPTLRIEKRHSSTEMSMEDLKHEIDSLNAQQQSVTWRK